MSVPHKDYTGAKFGMWLFLFTELLLFGGLFVLFSVYTARYPADFHRAATELNVVMGTANTLVLLSSSLSVALAISAIQRGNMKLAKNLTIFTVACAALFLVNKYFEWSVKFHHGIFPDSEYLATLPHGEQIFWGLYYTITGLHGLHVLLGGILLLVIWFMMRNGSVNQTDYVKLENAGLYWHLVDLIWIYVFPLFYLIS